MKRREDVKRQELLNETEGSLFLIRAMQRDISALEAEANEKMQAITDQYNTLLAPLRDEKAARAKELIALMKKNKGVLFDGTDVVNLPPGSLIRNIFDRISLPKTALADCEAQGFDDVIKIVKSLDRAAIEKWPDARLVLIGAERKTKEEFAYDLKK
jgi:phage host-nuclease inhibitor protein Gam